MPWTPVAGPTGGLFTREASILGKNPFFRQSQRKAQGQQASIMLCAAGRLQGKCQQNNLFGLRQSCSLAFQQNGAPAKKGAVGACWHKLSTILHSLAPNTGSNPAPLRDCQQVPTPQGPPFLFYKRVIRGTDPKRENWEIESFLKCTLSFHKN